MVTCNCAEPLEGFKIGVGPRCRLCNLQLEPTLEQLKAVADAVEYETETGDWQPLVTAMVKAGYPCKVNLSTQG